jgi:hypothetical protein
VKTVLLVVKVALLVLALLALLLALRPELRRARLAASERAFQRRAGVLEDWFAVREEQRLDGPVQQWAELRAHLRGGEHVAEP